MSAEWEDEARARANAATPGPWRVDRWWHHEWDPPREDTDQVPLVTAGDGRWAVVVTPPVSDANGWEQREPDAEFIAHSRVDIVRALDALAAVRAERDRLQRIIDGYDRTPAEERAAKAEQDARTAYTLYRAEQAERAAESKTADEVIAAVRTAVDDQPHADRCKHAPWDGERPCTCWKTEILHALDGHTTKEDK